MGTVSVEMLPLTALTWQLGVKTAFKTNYNKSNSIFTFNNFNLRGQTNVAYMLLCFKMFFLKEP